MFGSGFKYLKGDHFDMIPEEGTDVKVMAPTKDALDNLQQNTDRGPKPPLGSKVVGQNHMKKGARTISQGTAFTTFSTSSFMQMMNSPFKTGGLIPREKLIKEFVKVSKEQNALNATRLDQQDPH